ncbi:MAG: SGNH/GDSL hydrolase family protein [Planctomycetota bacterium]
MTSQRTPKPSPKGRSTTSRFIKRLLLSSTLIGLGFIVAEFLCHRLIHSSSYSAGPYVYDAGFFGGNPRYRYDPLVLWKPLPRQTRWFRNPDTMERHSVSTNSHGFRGPEITQNKPPGTVRIALLGDSFVEGLGLPENLHMRTLLESALRSRLPHQSIEVINAGVSGFDTAQEWAMLRDSILPLDPDYVIAFHCFNDLDDLRRSQLVDMDQQDIVSWRLGIKERPLAHHSMLRSFLLDRAMEEPSAYSVYEHIRQPDAETQRLLTLYEKIMANALKACHERNIHFLSVIIPDSKVYYPELWKEKAEQSIAYSKAILQIHKALNVPTVNLIDIWKPEKIRSMITKTDKALRGNPLYFKFDVHLSAMGHHALVVCLMETLNIMMNQGWEKWGGTGSEAFVYTPPPFPMYHPDDAESRLNAKADLLTKLPGSLRDLLATDSIAIKRITLLQDNAYSMQWALDVPPGSTLEMFFRQLGFEAEAISLDTFEDGPFMDDFGATKKHYASQGWFFQSQAMTCTAFQPVHNNEQGHFQVLDVIWKEIGRSE